MCTTLKQLFLGLDFAQRYRIGIDWDMYGKLFLRCEGKKTPSGKQYEIDQKLHLMTNNTFTIPLYHISIAPLKAIYHAICNKFKPNIIIEIEENHFLAIEQLDIVLIPILQKLGPQIPNVYMAVLWNPGGQTVILK